MRNKLSAELMRLLKVGEFDIKSVAIVGGSSREPELVALKEIYLNLQETYFGIESNEIGIEFYNLDLNEQSSNFGVFDLVICSQVLEHVWNFDVAIENLINLVRPNGGLLWINCPASNMVHGSPDYFSAGYSPEMLKKHLEFRNLTTINHGSFGSRRMYFFTHALNYWPTDFELAHPLISYRPLRSYGRKIIIESIRGFLGRTYSLLLPWKPDENLTFATESYILAKTKAF
jgi:SAM-dependent methyltransferase